LNDSKGNGGEGVDGEGEGEEGTNYTDEIDELTMKQVRVVTSINQLIEDFRCEMEE
jgi:hypothetical protein